MNKLNLNRQWIDDCRSAARVIAEEVDRFIAKRSTVAIERTVLRLLGIDGIHETDTPLVNVIVDKILQEGKLGKGVMPWILQSIVHYQIPLHEAVSLAAANKISLTEAPSIPKEEMEKLGFQLAEEGLNKIASRRQERDTLLQQLGEPSTPYLYVIVATGDIYEDVNQAKAAVYDGADIIAVIRSTGQSLLDYVPYGATREGFGGTFATQENFRIMRKALDEVGEEVGRYIRLCNYCSGLCMPEIAAMGGLERLDVMLNDALYGILFRDINMQRTLVDQYFSRMINSYAGIIINTGEDNYLTTADAVASAHTVLASQFINEQLAFFSGLPTEQLGLGHAFEMNPDLEDGLLLEIAQAQLVREVFPGAPLKYMPPTKHMTGNIFKGHIQDALFNLVGIMTGQGIQLLGMMTEAMHTPHIHDRHLAIENAKYIFNNGRHLMEEIYFAPEGRIVKRAGETLQKAKEMLEKTAESGLFSAIEKGWFADVKRTMKGGRGLDGVFIKDQNYFNPFEELLREKLGLPSRKGGGFK
ncbi:lysine 5,6-aminomutase subunit alpha [Microaerobacter geothermalis]|uniref:lysine 5,6-aminomutase subunit alpha n=1 Tax=Microaerobacter geothermalis TaxID=674972 RepID=UPI001F189B69|nr:lysine 5,6-aminomutase subunit alpha [Microaerobacter geothermalis]MCF6094091.1 lysine 5,6-aminomutase subunit alpha [Microaerobacter geothermalis]